MTKNATTREAEDERLAELTRRQRLRLQRFYMGAGTYFIFAGAAFYLAFTGAIALPRWAMAVYLLAIFVFNLSIAGLILTGRNLKFADPSFTTIQLLAGFIFQLALLAFSRTVFAQDLCILSFLLSLLFGSFKLTLRSILRLTVPPFVILVAMMLWRHRLLEETLGASSTRAIIYTFVFAGITFFAGYIGNLRHKLSARNEELRIAMDQIAELAIRDDLTGAFNRRYIDQLLADEIARAERADESLCVAMLDVDHFKAVNDRYGHAVGDEVLRAIVARLDSETRQLDQVGRQEKLETLGRLGGEEFVLVLPLTDLDGAARCIHRAHQRVGSTPIATDAGDVMVTVSGGVAQFQRGDDAPSLLKRADDALYHAKQKGRNRIELAEGRVKDTPV